MFQPSTQGAAASNLSSMVMPQPLSLAVTLPNEPDDEPDDELQYENLRHMLFGSLSAVQATIKLLHRLNYAEPNDWSQPISTGRANEVMAILTKKVRSA